MKSKLILILLFFSIATVTASATTLTSQQSKLDVNTVGISDFWGVMNVEQNQNIQLKITVGVHDISPVALDGFWIKVVFTKPSGQTVEKWFDFTKEHISKGTEKIYTIQTGIQADETGVWNVTVELWDKNKENKINYDSTTFQVTKTLPAAYVNVQQAIGYSIAGLALIGTPLLLRKYT